MPKRAVPSQQKKSKVKVKHPFPWPWGLLVVLAVYSGAVVGYIQLTYWSTPEYSAAQKYAEALHLLGSDEGKTCPPGDLERAMELLLEAARLVPDELSLAQRTERLRWRFDERHLKLREELRRHAEAVSAMARKREEAKNAILLIGLRNRGWLPEQVLVGPEKVMQWAIPGGVLIILVWVYGQFNSRRAREREHELMLQSEEGDVEHLGDFRKKGPQRTIDDDEVSTVDDETTAVDDDEPEAPAPKPRRRR